MGVGKDEHGRGFVEPERPVEYLEVDVGFGGGAAAVDGRVGKLLSGRYVQVRLGRVEERDAGITREGMDRIGMRIGSAAQRERSLGEMELVGM